MDWWYYAMSNLLKSLLSVIPFDNRLLPKDNTQSLVECCLHILEVDYSCSSWLFSPITSYLSEKTISAHVTIV